MSFLFTKVNVLRYFGIMKPNVFELLCPKKTLIERDFCFNCTKCKNDKSGHKTGVLFLFILVDARFKWVENKFSNL